MSCELPVYDKGTSLEFTIRDCGGIKDPVTDLYPIVDLTGNTGITIVFRKPDDDLTVIERAGVVYQGGDNGDATDGIVQYVTIGDEIDVIGDWLLEAIVEFSNNTPPALHTSKPPIEITVAPTLRHPAE